MLPKPQIIRFFFVFLALICLAICLYSPAKASTDAPNATSVPTPQMPAHPSQADQGHYVYYQVCMACHGDRGQGLTDEWRAQFGPEGMNCWQSKCHSYNHPREGFLLVKKVPAIMGPGTLTRFDNAQQLHDYITGAMPWWKPGYLPADEFWQVTAYLLRERGALPDNVVLDDGTAVVYLLRPVTPLPGDNRPAALIMAFILVMAAVLLFVQQKFIH